MHEHPTSGRTPGVECRALFERLSEFLDGELPADLCREIERHAGGCPPCHDLVQTLRRTVGLCRALPERPLPEEARAALRTLLRESFPPRVDR